MFSPLARLYTASGVRPNFKPITLVGVFWRAKLFNCDTSRDVQGFPEFLLYFAIGCSPSYGISAGKPTKLLTTSPHYYKLLPAILEQIPSMEGGIRGVANLLILFRPLLFM